MQSSNSGPAVSSLSLPILGAGEAYFHASFEVEGEDAYVEGVVAADRGDAAVSLLLHEAARSRARSYYDMLPQARHALARRLTKAEAETLIPKVEYSVSMWKRATHADTDPTYVGQQILSFS